MHSSAPFALVIALVAPSLVHADEARTAWYAAPQPVWDEAFILPSGAPIDLVGRTVEQQVRLSIAGRSVRLTLSNRYGRAPVTIGTVRFGPTSEPVSFGGHDHVVIEAGEEVVSDALSLSVQEDERVRVSFVVEDLEAVQSFHWDGRSTALLTGGARAPETSTARLYLSAVTVEPEQNCPTVVALGDSLTDGNGVPMDEDARWTDLLSRRSDNVVVNAGISGARLVSDGMGERGLDRLYSDVLIHEGVQAVVIILGTNDIAWPGSPFAPDDDAMSLDRLRDGYIELVAAARGRGLRVAGATLPPFRGALPGTPMAATYWTPDKERTRQALNAWMRTAAPFDILVDLDSVLRDPADPTRLRAAFDSGDHLHPGVAGNAAIASAIDLDRLLEDGCVRH